MFFFPRVIYANINISNSHRRFTLVSCPERYAEHSLNTKSNARDLASEFPQRNVQKVVHFIVSETQRARVFCIYLRTARYVGDNVGIVIATIQHNTSVIIL